MTTVASGPAVRDSGASLGATERVRRVDTKTARRRMVAYGTLADFVKDLDAVERSHRAGTLRTLGNRGAGPIFGHLAISIRGSFEGIPGLERSVPLWLRVVGPMVKGRIINRALRPGARLGRAAENMLWDDGLSAEEGLAQLRDEVARLGTSGKTLNARHPVFGELTDAEWRNFHLRHSELHMSFLGL